MRFGRKTPQKFQICITLFLVFSPSKARKNKSKTEYTGNNYPKSQINSVLGRFRKKVNKSKRSH